MNNHMYRIKAIEPAETELASMTKNSFDCTYLGNLPLAMAYVPFQRWSCVYDPCRALTRGTIFPDLDLPFCGRELT